MVFSSFSVEDVIVHKNYYSDQILFELELTVKELELNCQKRNWPQPFPSGNQILKDAVTLQQLDRFAPSQVLWNHLGP